MRTRQILCPTDFSETASHAVRYALEMAAFYHVGIRLMHVVDQPMGNENYQILAITPEEVAEGMEQAAAEKMKLLLSEFNCQHAVETVIRRGSAIEQILEDAEQHHVGMIVIASHGRTGLSHFLHTNVAEGVASGAKCPVLVVK
ncbi:universal stress protein UspA-like protein [Shewanella psychrophila]|uniref:Universal stress protein UspA-like protein n=1 Tax=Shewanella psychrophila TaxID=225848 RepID=A0A1S6HWA7_9GAMM|nr:universal stress protein [Shewanella psychrophila]AQS39845.1 universal stress protein UspA-like protein [Shewanella psychrophila]